MPLAQYLWGAVTGLVKTTRGVEDLNSSIPDVENLEYNPTGSYSSPNLQHAPQRVHSQHGEQVRTAVPIELQHSNTIKTPERKEANAGEVTIRTDLYLPLTDDTAMTGALQQKSQKKAVEQETGAA